MNSPESITPREAAHESAHNLKQVRLADQALRHALLTVEKSIANANDEALDAHRQSIGAYHSQFWGEKVIPERENDLSRAEQKASRDYQKHQGAYYQAALAEALLDGVEVSQ